MCGIKLLVLEGPETSLLVFPEPRVFLLRIRSISPICLTNFSGLFRLYFLVSWIESCTKVLKFFWYVMSGFFEESMQDLV
ncbi:hypothetical protein TB2_007276 [Malus domestica]